MSWKKQRRLEIEGRTVQEAIARGLAVLKTSRDRVHIQVLSEERRGLFGMRGVKQTKVRLTVKE